MQKNKSLATQGQFGIVFVFMFFKNQSKNIFSEHVFFFKNKALEIVESKKMLFQNFGNVVSTFTARVTVPSMKSAIFLLKKKVQRKLTIPCNFTNSSFSHFPWGPLLLNYCIKNIITKHAFKSNKLKTKQNTSFPKHKTQNLKQRHLSYLTNIYCRCLQFKN